MIYIYHTTITFCSVQLHLGSDQSVQQSITIIILKGECNITKCGQTLSYIFYREQIRTKRGEPMFELRVNIYDVVQFHQILSPTWVFHDKLNYKWAVFWKLQYFGDVVFLFQFQSSRNGKDWTVRPVRKPKNIQWKINITAAVIGCARAKMVPDTPPPVDIEHIRSTKPKSSFTKVKHVPCGGGDGEVMWLGTSCKNCGLWTTNCIIHIWTFVLPILNTLSHSYYFISLCTIILVVDTMSNNTVSSDTDTYVGDTCMLILVLRILKYEILEIWVATLPNF